MTERAVDPLLVKEAGHRASLLGNEAIVRGALEAGVAFAAGYPGTPSSEVTDSFARIHKAAGVRFEYSINEKIALEMAFAASLAGGTRHQRDHGSRVVGGRAGRQGPGAGHGPTAAHQRRGGHPLLGADPVERPELVVGAEAPPVRERFVETLDLVCGKRRRKVRHQLSPARAPR